MNVFIRELDDAQYQWFKTTDTAVHCEKSSGSLEDLSSFFAQNAQIKNWVYVLSSLEVANNILEFTDKEKKHIYKAIPFLLEDELLSDADDLHYVFDEGREKNSLKVAAVDQQVLTRILEAMQSQHIKLTHCIAEHLFLPESDDHWQIFYRLNQFIIQADNDQCLTIEADHIALALSLLSDDYAQLPSSVALITDSETDYEEAMKLMPAAMAPLIEKKPVNYADMLQQQFVKNHKTWNFLTGSFAQAKQWLSMLKPWRWVGLSLVAVFTLNMGLMMAELGQLKDQYAEIESQMDAVFREVQPKGKIVDHRKQLERQLKALGSANAGQPFIQRFEQIGRILAEHKVQSLNALNYDMSKSEMRLDFIVQDYAVIESIMTALNASGLKAEIQNSNAQGDQLRTRLRISG